MPTASREIGAGPGAGGRLYVTDTATSVIAHELGHNFRLGHSSGRQCNGSVEAGTCRTQTYRDYYDVMGVSWEQVGSLNAAQAALLGVLPSAQVQTVQASGTGAQIALSSLSGRSGTRAVRLVDSAGTQYWLEFRPAAGRDLWLGPAGTNRFGLQPGVLVRRSSSSSDTSLLLDATPSPATGWNTDWQTAVTVGGSVQLAGGDFTVSVQYVSGTTAAVQVSTGAEAAMARSGGLLVRTASDASVYVVSGARKYAIADMATLGALAPLGPLRMVSQAYLDERPTASRMSRTVLAPDGTAYFVDAGIKLPFTSCALVTDFGGSCDSLVRLEQPLIDRLHSGPPITPLYMTTSGKTFFVTGGTKREVVDPTALSMAGLPSAAVTLLESGLSALPYGPPVTRDGVVLRDRQTGAVAVSMGGLFTAVSEGVRAATALSSACACRAHELSEPAFPADRRRHGCVGQRVRRRPGVPPDRAGPHAGERPDDAAGLGAGPARRGARPLPRRGHARRRRLRQGLGQRLGVRPAARAQARDRVLGGPGRAQRR